MRALPLLLLLLLSGVSSQDDSISLSVTTKPGGDAPPVSTTATSTAQAISSKSNAGNPPSAPTVPPATTQGVMSKSNTGSSTSKRSTSPSLVTSLPNTSTMVPSAPAVSSSIAQMTSPISAPGKTSSTFTVPTSTAPGISPTSKPGGPPPIPVPSPSANPSASSAPLVSTTAVVSSAPQHQNSPSGSSQTTTVATSPRAAPGTPPLLQLPSTAASTTIPTGSLSPGLKDHVSSTKPASQQPHSSPSSEVQGSASSIRPGSVSTSVTPSAGSISPTASKTSQTLTPGSMDKVSLPTTTLTSGAGQTSHGQGPVTTKPVIAAHSPTSTQSSSPTPGHQTMSSRPGPQHPNDTFQNEVICEDQMQNSWPIINLKEAKTCAEWKALTLNGSLFKTFCSTDRYSYEPGRDKCTVTLASAEPRSQRWAVRAVVHLHLDPEKVFKELKEKKDELEELGITNVTFHNEQQEEEIKDRFSTPLIITIVTLAGSLLLVAAIYGCCHQRFSHKKDQQRLTEELQTMENGYHDNPTLEVMETSSEMQEKKVNLNGELGDSWIVPLDTLLKDELEEEEDTHL